MNKQRVLVVLFVLLILAALLNCQWSTAGMTNSEIINHPVQGTPWP
jgi:hypothetical protein